MALNPVQFLVYALGLLCCWIGRCVALRWGGSVLVAVLFAAMAVPALCYAAYYLRIWAEPMWLYRVRSWPYSELLAAPAGLLAGWLQGQLRGRWSLSIYSTSVLLLLLLAAPYVKQLSGPMPLAEKWQDGVCLQSSPSTCGPASAATLLTAMGIPTSESELALESFSTMSGTENWYLKRAIERRGVAGQYTWVQPPVQSLPHPSIAGVKLGQKWGHFIAVLAEDADGYTIADPMYGRSRLPKTALADQPLNFSGFFLVLTKKKEG